MIELCHIVCVVIVLASPAVVTAQIMTVVAAGQADGAGGPEAIQSVNEAVQNALTDFERFAERNDWQKAFRVLENLPPDKRVGMLPAGNGFMVPARTRLWQMSVNINAEGRAAFRLFNEPKAKQLFETMQTQLKANEPQAAVTAQEIYDQYFMTSFGDDAANLLGDIAFERGDFAEAALRWKAIIDYHGDSDIPLSRLMTKCATAYVAQGRVSDADSLLGGLKQRFASETVVIGGKEFNAVEYVQKLVGQYTSKAHASVAALEFQLPDRSLTPEWEVQFLTRKGRQSLQNAVQANSYYQTGLQTMVPNYDTDGERVFLNWMGIIFAVDVRTGKLLWRTEHFSKVHDHFNEMQQGRVNVNEYGIQVVGDRVLTTALPLDRLNYWQPPIPLTSWNAKTGEKQWSVGGDQNGGISYLGKFLPWNNGLLVVSHPQQQPTMSLTYLNLSSGTAEWAIPLGSFQGQNNPYTGGMMYGTPEFATVGTQLNLMNNSGSLLQINPSMKTIEGQFELYKKETTTDGSYYYSNYGFLADEKRLHTRGRVLEKEGLLLIKEVGRTEMYCLDVVTQKVVWKRPTSSSAMIVDVDDQFVYVMNSELAAYNRATGKLQWSINLPVNGGGLSLVSAGPSVFVATQRGIFEIDRELGKVRRIVRMSGTDATGVSMRMIGDFLVTVSNYQVAGYRLKGTAPREEAAPSTEPQASPAPVTPEPAKSP